MKIKAIIAALLLFMGVAFQTNAQVKIGYTNIEVILAYMPEAKVLEQQLQTYQKKLAENLKVKEDYARAKLQEYQDAVTANRWSPEVKTAKETELLKLDEEITKMAQDSEYDLMAKREELLEPVLEKLQKAIDQTAEEKGYTYILNQTTSAGVSTILFGPEEDDVTEVIMKKLGIAIPEPQK